MFNYEASENLLANRVVLVTGASDGIGKAVAIQAAACGATVILLSRNVEKLESVYDEIESSGYPVPVLYPLDLLTAVPENYTDLGRNIKNEFGRLDGIVHCAAHFGSLTPIEHYKIEQWFNVLHVNLNAPFLITQACLPLLKDADDASVVFVSSAAGRSGKAYWGASSVAKFGVEGLSQILAEELDENSHVRVNTVDPGPVRTKMRMKAFPGEDPSTLAKPGDITPIFLYLLGPDSKEVNGEQLCAQPQARWSKSD